MKNIVILTVSAFAAVCARADAPFVMDKSVMSEKYWQIWNDDVQKQVDENIERNRKADAAIEIDAADGTEVEIKQVSHAFYFGAHIFNFNQLGRKEYNERYKELYGTLFNSATVAFYWKTLEPYCGEVRFKESYEDTELFWNTCPDPMNEPHWRRPAPDPVIAFLKTRGVRIHGHPLCWGNNAWHTPSWIWDEFCPKEEKEALFAATGVRLPTHNWRLPMGVKERGRDESYAEGVVSWPESWKKIFAKLSEEEVARLCPTYFANFNRFTTERVKQIAAKYGTRVDSWDVCNESAEDFNGNSATGKPFQRSPRYGVTAGDLCYNAFKTAQSCLPQSAWLNINDYHMGPKYIAQIADLEKKGCKIDVVGSQMHLFNPQESVNIAKGEGASHLRPANLFGTFKMLSKANKPIHLSEITITAPDNTPNGQMVQAIIMRNLYRAWFSIEKMCGITWWNVVDNCGAPGEPSISGIFTRDMKPKTAYFAMNDLINREWKTNLKTAVKDSRVSFRGFRGKYVLTWKGKDGKTMTKYIDVK